MPPCFTVCSFSRFVRTSNQILKRRSRPLIRTRCPGVLSPKLLPHLHRRLVNPPLDNRRSDNPPLLLLSVLLLLPRHSVSRQLLHLYLANLRKRRHSDNLRKRRPLDNQHRHLLLEAPRLPHQRSDNHQPLASHLPSVKQRNPPSSNLPLVPSVLTQIKAQALSVLAPVVVVADFQHSPISPRACPPRPPPITQDRESLP